MAGTGERTDVITVVVCDDHPLMLDSLGIALGRDERFEVVGCYHDAVELLERYTKGCARLLVMDVAMGPVGGIAAARELLARDDGLKVMFLSAFGDPHKVREALEMGAMGYMLKTTAVGQLKEAMTSAAGGTLVLDSGIDLRAGSGQLSPRQMEILELMDQGVISRRAMAQELLISTNTVKSHINAMYTLLGVNSALEAVAKARELGWLAAVDT